MTAVTYLDNSATTPVRPEVAAAMRPFLSREWGNPSSVHHVGRTARQAIETAREQISSLIGAAPEEIFFTPGATYSNNAAILGRARWVEEYGFGRHLITTGIEHSSALGPAKHLEKNGWRVTILPVDKQGFVNPAHLRDAITPDTSIISIMWANNEVGTVQPIADLAAIATAKGIFFHTDAVQVAGKLPINVANLNIDTLSLSGHKFYAPKGIGVLYVKKGVEIEPVLFGGGQERKLVPGTEALSSIVGIGKAAELSHVELESTRAELKRLQEILLRSFVHNGKVSFTGPSNLDQRIPGHLSFILHGVLGEDVIEAADKRKICISSVSACSSAGKDPSHVLKSLGYSRTEALGSVRISAGIFNTEKQVIEAARTLNEIINAKSRPSPVVNYPNYVTSLAY